MSLGNQAFMGECDLPKKQLFWRRLPGDRFRVDLVRVRNGVSGTGRLAGGHRSRQVFSASNQVVGGGSLWFELWTSSFEAGLNPRGLSGESNLIERQNSGLAVAGFWIVRTRLREG